MRLVQRLRGEALCCALLLTTSLQGCAAAAAAIPIVHAAAEVISMITGGIDSVESQVRNLSDQGVVPADIAARIAKLREIADVLNSDAKLAPATYEYLVQRFQDEWGQLLGRAGRYGVHADDDAGRLAAKPGDVLVPSASELGKRLRAGRVESSGGER